MLGLRKKIIKNIRKIKFDVILDFLILMGIRRKCEKNKTYFNRKCPEES